MHVSDCAIFNPVEYLWKETEKIMQIKHVKGDISRFFIFHCKFLLHVGFNVFIKNPDHFPQCSVIK